MAKFFSSLRTRLILLVLLAALPSLGIMLYTGVEQRQKATEAAQQQVLQLAKAAAINQEMFIQNTQVFITAIAHMPFLVDNDMQACKEVFSELIAEHYPYFATFYVADTHGNVVCRAPGLHVPDDLMECGHYKQILKTKDFSLSDYHICEATGKAIVAMGYPIFNRSDEMISVLNISLDLAWINELAAESELPPGATLDVYDRKGNIMAHYPDPAEWNGKLLPPDSFLGGLFMQKEGAAVGPGLDGVRRLYAITPMEKTGESVFVSLGIPVDVAFAEADRTLTRNLLVLASMTVLALVAAWLLGDVFIVRQTRALVTATQRLAAGDLKGRAEVGYEQGELGQLAQAFDQMAESLDQRENQREQAENAMREYASDLERSNRDLQDFANIASHDLQEPLRKIQTFSEMLQERNKAQLDERGQDYLVRIHEAAQRMQVLIMDLLSYSRLTTRGQPFERVDLSQVVQSVLNDLELRIAETHAQVVLDGLPAIDADATQMRQLFQNLLSNAIKFQPPGNTPRVQISAQNVLDLHPNTGQKKPAEFTEITVSDNGIGFDEKYLDRIFQPFQRLHARNEYYGTGIGLAICRKIVERHGGSINARSQPGQGAAFIIRLPKRQLKQGAMKK